MEDFKDIQILWKDNVSATEPNKEFKNKIIKSNKEKIELSYILGALILFIMGIINILLLKQGQYGNYNLIKSIVFILISVLCIVQSSLYFTYFKKVKAINEIEIPPIHLKQWIDFQGFRKIIIHRNLLIFNLMLALIVNILIVLYIPNISLEKTILSFLFVNIWILYAYFYLGKKEAKKQVDSINKIINNLKNIENQLN
jgi:hypothetical protein